MLTEAKGQCLIIIIPGLRSLLILPVALEAKGLGIGGVKK